MCVTGCQQGHRHPAEDIVRCLQGNVVTKVRPAGFQQGRTDEGKNKLIQSVGNVAAVFLVTILHGYRSEIFHNIIIYYHIYQKVLCMCSYCCQCLQ